MTDTERKALAWARQWEDRFVTPYPPARLGALMEIFTEREAAIQSAIERHEAELREQAERFSEAARKALSQAVRAGTTAHARGVVIGDILSPFILPEPEPDPLVEVMNEMGFGWSKTASEEFRAAIEKCGYKIERIEP